MADAYRPSPTLGLGLFLFKFAFEILELCNVCHYQSSFLGWVHNGHPMKDKDLMEVDDGGR